MTAFQKKPIPQENRVAKALGVTASGLRALSRAYVNPEGRVLSDGSAIVPLEREGYVTAKERPSYMRFLTDAGRDVVRRAREMGW